MGTQDLDLNNQAVNKDCSPTFVNMTLTGPVAMVARLASVSGIDVGAAASTHLYTVPLGRTCIITKVYIRGASGTFDQATDPVMNIGWDGTASNVVASATLTTPTAATQVIPLTVLATQTVGAAGAILHFNVTTAATAATTCTVEVFGYLV
jgi:hypothetical protein